MDAKRLGELRKLAAENKGFVAVSAADVIGLAAAASGDDARATAIRRAAMACKAGVPLANLDAGHLAWCCDQVKAGSPLKAEK